MPAPEVIGGLILKLVGSVIGAALALIFVPPRGWRDFRRRAMFAILAGACLTPLSMSVLKGFFHVADDPETLVAVACITAFASWWAAGTARRIMKSWDASE